VGCLYLVAAFFVLLLRAWKITEVECKAVAESNGSSVSHMERIPVFGWLRVKNVFVMRRV
jgi:hypothetical protein